MKKRLACMLALALVLSAIGCVGGVAESTVTLQLIMPSNVQEFPDGVTANDNFIVDYWREHTGYDFDIIVLSPDGESEKLNVMFNSGELTGMVFRRGASHVGQLASQGLIAPLDEYMADSKFFQTFDYCQSVGQYEGEQYAAVIPSDGIGYSSQNGLWFVNKTAMAELGYDQPPATFEEFDEMLYAAKDAGYLPLAILGNPGNLSNGSTFSIIQAMFGLSGNEYGIRDDEVISKILLPEAKEYLEYVTRLYADGIIPSDFASQTEDGVVELLLSGRALTATGISVWTGKNVMVQAEELGMDIRYADYPATRDGNKAYGEINLSYGGVAQAVVISSACPYIEDCVKFLDFLVEPETIAVNNYGLEGVHYNLDENGQYILTEEGNNLAWAVYYRNIFLPEDWYSVYGIGAGWAEYYYPAERISVGNPDFDPIIHLPVNSDYVTELDDLRDNLVVPAFTNIVMGTASIDEFDTIAQQWAERGGQEILDYYTELWISMDRPTYEYTTQLLKDSPAYTGKYLFNGPEDLATQIYADD